jgi:hypothetical protein
MTDIDLDDFFEAKEEPSEEPVEEEPEVIVCPHCGKEFTRE